MRTEIDKMAEKRWVQLAILGLIQQNFLPQLLKSPKGTQNGTEERPD